MSDRIHVIAGRCASRYVETDAQTRERLGDSVVICKPDDTVLVHDADGYQPVAWLTRADDLTIDDDVVTATDGDRVLRVRILERYGGGRFPIGSAGTPVGECPTCDCRLIRTNGAVSCPDCDATYRLPGDATLVEQTCGDCGLPQFRITRGETFVLCLDRSCESIDDHVGAAFDRQWNCPACGDDLRVLRRGGLILGCASYPDCETGFSFPAGEIVDACDCGLPVFETNTGRRCLNVDCERSATATPQGI